MPAHRCCQCESQDSDGTDHSGGWPVGTPAGRPRHSGASRGPQGTAGVPGECGPSRNPGGSRASWEQRAAPGRWGGEAGPPQLWFCHRNTGAERGFGSISLDTEGAFGGCQMLARGRWAVPLPLPEHRDQYASWPPPGGRPAGWGRSPCLEHSWSVAGLTLVICPPDGGLPGAAGHCQSAVGDRRLQFGSRARWAEFPFPTGRGGEGLGESRHCLGAGVGERHVASGQRSQDPATPLAEADAPKRKRLLHLCLVEALRLICLLPEQVSLRVPVGGQR